MFKLIGMAVGVGLVFCAGIAILGSSKAPKQLQTEPVHQSVSSVKAEEPPVESASEQIKDPETRMPDELNNALQEIEHSMETAQSEIDDSEELIAIDETETEGQAKQQFVFWQPFTTQASAFGFAQRLTQQTGVEMSVISHKFNSHSVLFYYADENEKNRILELIKTTTGLDLGDSI